MSALEAQVDVTHSVGDGSEGSVSMGDGQNSRCFSTAILTSQGTMSPHCQNLKPRLLMSRVSDLRVDGAWSVVTDGTREKHANVDSLVARHEASGLQEMGGLHLKTWLQRDCCDNLRVKSDTLSYIDINLMLSWGPAALWNVWHTSEW